MKILLVHSDFIEFEPKQKAIKAAKEVEKKKERIAECLVAFVAVESRDEKNPDQSASKLCAEIEKTAKDVGAERIVLYPYAHLSNSLASPETADKIMNSAYDLLRKNHETHKAPFGYYKSFTISCKGHPLSELSREFGADDDTSEALKKEETLKSEWFILEPSGKMNQIRITDSGIEGFDFRNYPGLEKLVKYELKKDRSVKEAPPHIKLMQKLQLVDYEEGSDPGNFRYTPYGKLVKSLLEEWTTQCIVDHGAMEVETPIMYDYEHPSLKKYLHRFPARQYVLQTPNKKTFLRFSACFGQFLLAHDTNISYKSLPLSFYELTRYSFRVEQRGELAGLRRLRTFTMPDCHALCKDMEQAKAEMLRRYDTARKVQEGIGFSMDDFEFAIRVVKDFFESNRDFFITLAKKMNKPLLLETWDKRFFYFVTKYEWNFIDALDKAATLTTDQIDVENGERFDLRYTDSDNEKKHPIILHLSPSGAIERVMYALLERAYMQQKAGKNPILPLWLTPTQARLCPVNDTMTEYCDQLAKSMRNVRVDIDDRTESIGKKIRDAETDWIPLIIVVGEKERQSGKLPVRFRESGKVIEMTPEEIMKFIENDRGEKPFRKLAMPMHLSKRPIFFG